MEIWLAGLGVVMTMVGVGLSWYSSGVSKRLTADQKAVARTQGEVAADQDAVARKQDEVAADQDAVARKQDEVAADQDAVARKQDEVAADQKAVVRQQEKIAADQEAWVATQKDLWTRLFSEFTGLSKQIRESNRWNAVSLVGVALTLLSLVLTQCGAGPISIRVVSGDGQSTTVGQTLPEPVVVEVRRTDTEPVPEVTVVFAPANGHGTASPVVVATDSTGKARTSWTLGLDPGQQTLVAAASDQSVRIGASAEREPSTPDSIHISPESGMLPSVGDTMRFLATVVDQYGDPFPAVVTWSSKRQCIVRAEDDGLVTALDAGSDSVVAVSGSLRTTAPVTVRAQGR